MNVDTTRATTDLDNEPRIDFSTPKPKPSRCPAVLMGDTEADDVQCEVIMVHPEVYGHAHRAVVNGRCVHW